MLVLYWSQSTTPLPKPFKHLPLTYRTNSRSLARDLGLAAPLVHSPPFFPTHILFQGLLLFLEQAGIFPPQGLFSCNSFCLERSSPRYTHSLTSPSALPHITSSGKPSPSTQLKCSLSWSLPEHPPGTQHRATCLCHKWIAHLCVYLSTSFLSVLP